MSEEINDVINNLCEKFGTTVTELAPEMAKYEIARGMTTLILGVVLVLVLLVVWMIARKKYYEAEKLDRYDYRERQDNAENVYFVATMLLVLVTAGYLTMTMIKIAPDIVGWAASPQAALIKEIARMIG